MHVIFWIILIAGVILRLYGISERMTHVDDIGFLPDLLAMPTAEEAADYISRAWTFGPSQFLATWHLARYAHTWDELLVMARLPSALFSIGGLFLFAAALACAGKWRTSSVVVFALAAFNLRGIIEAQQAYVYASTFFAGMWISLGLTLLQKLNKSFIKWSLVLMVSIFLATKMVSVSYQNIFLLPAFFIGILYTIRGYGLDFNPSRKLLAARLFAVLLTGFFSTRYAYTIYQTRMLPLSQQGFTPVPSWATEETWHYTGLGLGDVFQFFGFMFRRFGSLVYYQLTPLWPGLLSSSLTIALQTVGVVLLAYGVYYTFRKSDALSAFSVTLLLTFLILAYMELALLGGSRHGHILLVPLLWFMKAALDGLRDLVLVKIHQPRLARSLSMAAVLLVPMLFFLGQGEFRRSTDNNYQVRELDDLCKQHNVGTIFEFEWTWDYTIALQKDPAARGCKSSERVLLSGVPSLVAKLGQNRPGTRVLFSSHRLQFAESLPDIEKNLTSNGFKFTIVKNLAERGSTEMFRHINGGNGFYVALIEKL